MKMEYVMYSSWVVIYLLFYLNEYKMTHLPGIEGAAGTKASRFLGALVKTGILFLSWQLHLPLLVVYVLLLCGYAMTFWPIRKRNRQRLFFWTNLFGTCFLAVHLIGLSVVSLVSKSMLRDVYHDNTIYLSALCMTLIVLTFTNTLWKGPRFVRWVTFLTGDEKRFNQLAFFEWFGVGYLLFDSVPFLFPLPYFLLSIFLIGSCILLMIQFLLFAIHTYKIIEKAHYEAEYYELEEERADHIQKQMVLRKLAYIDGLTGAFTRRYAMEMLESMQKDKLDVTVAYIDVNGLKRVNDTLGHSEGDRYLKLIANSLNSSLHKSDVLARIGGDEFLIVFNSTEIEALECKLKDVNEALAQTGCEGYTPSFSYGVVAAPQNEAFDLDALLRESDQKMYDYKLRFKKEAI